MLLDPHLSKTNVRRVQRTPDLLQSQSRLLALVRVLARCQSVLRVLGPVSLRQFAVALLFVEVEQSVTEQTRIALFRSSEPRNHCSLIVRGFRDVVE